jgi:hypothetical protein
METKHRKVMVYEFKHVSGKGYDKFEVGIGDFLAFGIAADEDAHSSFSIAIVEMPDGTVRAAELNLIRFLQDPRI